MLAGAGTGPEVQYGEEASLGGEQLFFPARHPALADTPHVAKAAVNQLHLQFVSSELQITYLSVS